MSLATIELFGGPFDGMSYTVPKPLPWTWRVAVPVSLDAVLRENVDVDSRGIDTVEYYRTNRTTRGGRVVYTWKEV